MRRLRGRALHPDDCYVLGCLSPPSPPYFHSSPSPAPVPAPAPAPTPRRGPSWFDPCPPVLAPSPAPVHGAPPGARRDQGGVHGYGSPPGGGGGGGGDGHRRVVTYALVAVAAIAFVSLILLGVSVAVRRRQVRRRRQALLAAPAAAAAPTDADDDGPEGGGGGGGGGVVHHIWYIRTVGLDEAAIDSIAATRYRAGAGLLGAADCTVCLGEFQDGELVRLLPKCGHAFHVPCIDTWLRAHVNCPLCRSDVLDPAVTADHPGGSDGAESVASTPDDPAANDNAAAEEADATSDAMAEHGQEESNNRGPSPAEEDRQSSLPEPPPQLPCPRPQNVRRAASMDAAIVSTAADVEAALERLPEAAPGEEQSGRRKRGTAPSGAKASGSGHRSNLSNDRPASVGIPRSFFSRHCRARSSVLPL